MAYFYVKKIRDSGPLFIIIGALLWSYDGVLRRGLYTVPPAVVVFWEHILGAVLLLPFMIQRRREIFTMTRKEWISVAVISLFSGALGTILYTTALGKVNYIQFSVVVLLQQLQPIWAILTAALLLKEKITRQFIIWAVIAIVGSYFVTFRDLRVNISASDGTFVAAILALSAGIVWATSTSFSKIVLRKVSTITATFLRFILAPVFAYVIMMIFQQTAALTTIDRTQWIALGTITLSTGMVALLIYYYGLKKTSARVSTICELVWPVSAIFIDYFYFHNTFSLTQILGVIAVLFAIYKVSIHHSRLKKTYEGVVLKGTQDARKIGFPTVNLDPEILSHATPEGVYASIVTIDNKKYTGALFYGPRLVKKETQPVLEIHILDFDQDIYGKHIEFELKRFIRKTRNFKTIEKLQKQIRWDINQIKKISLHDS